MNMANLAARSMGARQDLSIHHDAAAHAGAQRDHQHVGMTLAAAEPHLAQRRHVGVISGFAWKARQLCQLPRHFLVAPAQVRRMRHDPVFRNRARHIYADSGDLLHMQAVLLDFLFNGSRHIRQDSDSLVLRPGGNLPLVQNDAVLIEKTQLYGRTSDVGSKTVFFHILPPLAL